VALINLTYDQIVHQLLPDVEFHQNRYAREVDEALTAGGRWLDLGAGSRLHGGWRGVTQEQLRQRAGLVVGCDVSALGLRANPFLGGAVRADGAHLPFGEASFDLVTANMVLEHLPAPQSVFAEIRRILKPGGRFVFVTPNRGHPAVWLLSVLLGRDARRRVAASLERRELSDVFPTFYRANSLDSIREAAARAQLEAVRVERFNSFPMVRYFAPLTWVECWWIRLTLKPALERFRSNIVGRLHRPGAA
jgi:SAM-dependent methyltransferase